MNDPKLLIVFASRYGQTEKIARRIAAIAGPAARVVSIADADDIHIEEFDALIVAGGVYFGRHDRRLEDFVRRKLGVISTVEAAFISVSGSANESYVHEFARRTGWVPELHATFHGGEPYTKYGFFVRWMMRSIARRHGRKVDVHRDYEFTDWASVDRFGRDFLGYVSVKRSA
ncbi:MAG TPA: flavodoxin domain-containing protein [Thermoanaerobaculia bacterium]|nr:flavodoxin domain-containing protein [Thermoanaerobaculia bacterium]